MVLKPVVQGGLQPQANSFRVTIKASQPSLQVQAKECWLPQYIISHETVQKLCTLDLNSGAYSSPILRLSQSHLGRLQT
jgi:hypothetical protein